MQYLLWQHFSGGLHLGKTMRRPSYEWRLSSCQQQPHITMPIFSSGRGGSTVLNIRSQSYTFVLFIFRGCGMLWPTFQESNLRQQGDASETGRPVATGKLCHTATVTATLTATVAQYLLQGALQAACLCRGAGWSVTQDFLTQLM